MHFLTFSKLFNLIRSYLICKLPYREEKKKQKKWSVHKVLNEQVNFAKTFIKNLSDVSLTNGEIFISSKILKFAPTPSPPTTRDILNDFDDLARRMRTRLWLYVNEIKRKTDPFLSKIRKKVDIPSDNISLENYLTETKVELANLHNRRRFSKEKTHENALHNICINRKFKEKVRNNFSPNLRVALIRLTKTTQT